MTDMCQRPSVAPRQFKSLALPDYFRGPLGGGMQHDCSEFARIFLDKLETEMKQSGKIENINLRYLEG